MGGKRGKLEEEEEESCRTQRTSEKHLKAEGGRRILILFSVFDITFPLCPSPTPFTWSRSRTHYFFPFSPLLPVVVSASISLVFYYYQWAAYPPLTGMPLSLSPPPPPT